MGVCHGYGKPLGCRSFRSSTSSSVSLSSPPQHRENFHLLCLTFYLQAYFYAIVDGLFTLAARAYKGIADLLLKIPKSPQLSFFSLFPSLVVF